MSLKPTNNRDFLDNVVRGAEKRIRERIHEAIRNCIDQIIEEECGVAALEIRQLFVATDMDTHVQIAIVKSK